MWHCLGQRKAEADPGNNAWGHDLEVVAGGLQDDARRGQGDETEGHDKNGLS